ncbi:hypothetical protein [Candidatus Frankia alpina]|uniref:hypothetical protein n=1 Tax=Candidatus Frankia alpina TaxID=2699483 RepID=UPI0013D8DA4C|nr:hypothetical protein [Candidatus Frankia alpina]
MGKKKTENKDSSKKIPTGPCAHCGRQTTEHVDGEFLHATCVHSFVNGNRA